MKTKEYPTFEGIRKVRWDMLWHILYTSSGKDTWDRVTKPVALSTLRRYEKGYTVMEVIMLLWFVVCRDYCNNCAFCS